MTQKTRQEEIEKEIEVLLNKGRLACLSGMNGYSILDNEKIGKLKAELKGINEGIKIGEQMNKDFEADKWMDEIKELRDQKVVFMNKAKEGEQKAQALWDKLNDKLRFDVLCKDCVTNLQFIDEIKKEFGLK